MSDLFKTSAIDVYLNNIQENTELTDYELELIETAFSTGFNIGMFTLASDDVKEVALKTLSLKTNV